MKLYISSRKNSFAWPSIALVAAVGAASMLLNPSPLQGSPLYHFQVLGNTPWLDTGLDLSAGDRLDVSATGTVYWTLGTAYPSDPNGIGGWDGTQKDPSTIIPSAIVVSMVGKIGGTLAIGTGTPVPEGLPGHGAGFVGSSYSEVMPTAGRLFLGFNDIVNDFWDNSGSYSVSVSIVTVPEPCTAALLGLGVGALATRLQSIKSRGAVGAKA